MSEGATYERLAAAARDAGHRDITPSRVHRWVRDQLLPATVQRVPRGRHGFAAEPSTQARKQLLALCAMRSRTKRLDQLAVLMWATGWEIPLARIRRALRTYAPHPVAPPKPPERDEAEWQLAKMAYKYAPGIQARFGWRGVGREQVAEAVLPIFRRLAGLRARIGERDAVVIEQLTGLTRARHDTVGELDPWLQSAPSQALATATELSFSLADHIATNATDQNLNDAGRRLRFWLETAPKVAELVAAAGDPEFAALHVFATVRANRAVEGLVLMLFFDRVGLSSTHDELIAAITDLGHGPRPRVVEGAGPTGR